MDNMNIKPDNNPEEKTEGRKSLKTIVVCVVIIAVLLVGGMAIHAGRSQKAMNTSDTHMEFDLGEDTAGAID